MNEYIQNWLDIIENMRNDNTYKLAWGRALIELAIECNTLSDSITFSFYDIAHKMLKYYWNQIFFFNLKQSSNKKPCIVSTTEECIEYICKKRQSKIPIWFDKAETILKEDPAFFDQQLKRIANKLKDDVSYRFLHCKGKVIPIYTLDKTKKTVTFTSYQIKQLQQFGFVLSQLLNYRWAQLLENFNSAPRIASKVKGISDAKIRRHNLTQYKNLLISQMQDGHIIDFYTGEVLDDKQISVDHVIPWSFMYSDDIWNLVLMEKNSNSIKSNTIPSEETIAKLEKRNKQLLTQLDKEIIKDNDCSNIIQYRNDLKEAIDNDYVNKFYLAMKL